MRRVRFQRKQNVKEKGTEKGRGGNRRKRNWTRSFCRNGKFANAPVSCSVRRLSDHGVLWYGLRCVHSWKRAHEKWKSFATLRYCLSVEFSDQSSEFQVNTLNVSIKWNTCVFTWYAQPEEQSMIWMNLQLRNSASQLIDFFFNKSPDRFSFQQANISIQSSQFWKPIWNEQ